MKTKDLIAKVISLPVEERAVVVESILNSLNPPDPIVDKKQISVAKRRSGSALIMNFSFHPEAEEELFYAIDYYKEEGATSI